MCTLCLPTEVLDVVVALPVYGGGNFAASAKGHAAGTVTGIWVCGGSGRIPEGSSRGVVVVGWFPMESLFLLLSLSLPTARDLWCRCRFA